MLYSDEELQVYTKERNVLCMDKDCNIYGVAPDEIHPEDNMRYKLFRNLVENIHVYYRNKYFFRNSKGINSKYIPEMNYISNCIRKREKPLDEIEFNRHFVGNTLLQNKRVVAYALNK